MNKTLLNSIAFMTILAISVGANEKLLNEKDLEVINKIKELPIVKKHKFIPSSLLDGGSLIFAKGYFNTPNGKKPATMYVSKDYQTIIYGRGFDSNTSEEYKSYTIKELKKNAGIVYGTGKDEYFLVVDPLCPACMSFDKTLPTFEKNITLYVLFMPLTKIHPTAPNAIAYILSQKTEKEKWKALQKISHGDKSFEKFQVIPKNIQTEMNKQNELAFRMGTRATPTLYTKKAIEIDRGILQYKYGSKEKSIVESKTERKK